MFIDCDVFLLCKTLVKFKKESKRVNLEAVPFVVVVVVLLILKTNVYTGHSPKLLCIKEPKHLTSSHILDHSLVTDECLCVLYRCYVKFHFIRFF